MSAGAIRMGRAFVEIGGDPSKLFRSLAAINRRIGQLGANMRAMGGKMTAATVAMAAPVALAARQFAAFDDAIRLTAAVSGAAGADLQMLNDRARKLGETTSFTAIQVSELMSQLGRGGFRPDEINAMTGAVLDLARASGTDAAVSAGIMTATLRQFALGAGDAARAADVLTKAANATFNTVEGLGESLQYAGPVAQSLGMSLEDTVAILGVLGNVGIQGSNAGTALRRLSVIAAGSGEELQKVFGVSNTNADGSLKSLINVLDEINVATKDMTVADRTAKMKDAFGLLGITSATVLSNTAGGVRGLADDLRNAEGTAAKTAKEMDAGLGGAMRMLLSAVEGTAIALGDALSPSLQSLADSARELAGGFTAIIKANQETIQAMAKGLAVFGSVGVALITVGASLQLISFGLGGLTSAASMVLVPLVAIVKTVALLGVSFVVATAKVLAYSVASVAAAVASGTAWAIANAPLLALVGILAGVGAVILQLVGGFEGLGSAIGGSFTTAVRNAGGVFSDLGSIANDTFNGIKDALASGDLQEAMEIAMAGVVAAFTRATSALLKNLDSTWANIQNTFDAMKSYAKQPLMMFEAIKDPFVEQDRRALRERQDARLQAVESRDADRRKKSDAAAGALAGKVRGSAAGRVMARQFADLLRNIENASSIDQLRDLYGEYDALSSNGRLTAAQASTISDALDDAQMRISKGSASMGGVGQSRRDPPKLPEFDNQAEIAGTFSAAAIGQMGFGQNLAQKQVDLLGQIEENTRNLEGGSVRD